ncbi:MAG: hypothetical protein AAF830_14660 [Pseudomonadota bacterium]
MAQGIERETSSERLLYDDAAPRLRRPVNATVLKFRRPAFLFLPLALALAPAIATAILVMGLSASTPDFLQMAAMVFGSFFFVCVVLALLFARRSEGSFALFTPNLISAAHAGLLIAFIAALVMPQAVQMPAAQMLLGTMPGPELPNPQLGLFKAYVVLFALITAACVAAGIVLRWVCFRRVVAGTA